MKRFMALVASQAPVSGRGDADDSSVASSASMAVRTARGPPGSARKAIHSLSVQELTRAAVASDSERTPAPVPEPVGSSGAIQGAMSLVARSQIRDIALGSLATTSMARKNTGPTKTMSDDSLQSSEMPTATAARNGCTSKFMPPSREQLRRELNDLSVPRLDILPQPAAPVAPASAAPAGSSQYYRAQTAKTSENGQLEYIWLPPDRSPRRSSAPLSSVRLDKLDQHPHVLLLPAGVAPLLHRQGVAVVGYRPGGAAAPASPSAALELPRRQTVAPGAGGPIDAPHDRDVLLGCRAVAHRGNVFHRDVVARYRPAYRVAARGDKRQLAANLVNYFRVRDSRFLERNQATSQWHEVGDARAAGKTSQSLRATSMPSSDVKAVPAAAAESVSNKATVVEGNGRSIGGSNIGVPRQEQTDPMQEVARAEAVLHERMDPSAQLFLSLETRERPLKLHGTVFRTVAKRTLPMLSLKRKAEALGQDPENSEVNMGDS